MKWELFVGAGKAGNEMIFPRSDCAFGGIATMVMRWGELEINVLFAHEFLE